MKLLHTAVIAGAVLWVGAGPVLADVAEEFNRRAADRDIASFRALDRDGDGRLTFAEVYGNVDMQARFKDMDINSDDVVTAAEFAHYIRQRYGVELPSAAGAAVQSRDTATGKLQP